MKLHLRQDRSSTCCSYSLHQSLEHNTGPCSSINHETHAHSLVQGGILKFLRSAVRNVCCDASQRVYLKTGTGCITVYTVA